ncbi:MAG TPA: SIMPL domain-containing protein [Solirubrobacterales bacterium]
MPLLRRLVPLSLIAIAVALLAPAAAIAQERTVSVNGSITQQVANDSAGLGFAVSKERKTRGAALRVVAQRLRAVIAAVQTIPGVDAIATGSISVRKVSAGKQIVYRAGEGIHLILRQPEKAGELVSVAVRAGATGINGPSFFVGNPAAAYDTALTAAFDQARERAATLAARAGATLGPAISIEEGGGVETPLAPEAKSAPACGGVVTTKHSGASASLCAGGTPPVKPGASTVTATVHVVFALQ